MTKVRPRLATFLAILMISSVMVMIYSPTEDFVEAPVLKDETETQIFDSSGRVSISDSPIRTTEKNSHYSNVEYSWSSSFNRYTWTQEIGPLGIDGYEIEEFWFYVSSQNVGAKMYASLKTVDRILQEDPDLNLYLYNPSGTKVDSSISSSSWTESVSAYATSSGYWKVKVVNYEGFSGHYDLERTFHENAAPKVRLTKEPLVDFRGWLNQPYIHENWGVNACESYDPDGHSLSYSWELDGVDTMATSCLGTVQFHDTNTHYIRVTVSDSSGKSTTDLTTITPLAFPIWTRPMGDLVISMDDVRSPSVSKESSVYYIDIPGTSNDVWTKIELEYKFKTTQDGQVTYSSEMVELEAGERWRLDMNIKDIDAEYSLEFKPEIVLWFYFADDGQWRDLRLPVPSLIEVESYPNQPYFYYEGQKIYYWRDYVEIPLETENGAMTYSLDERVQLSGIDLYPFVEELVDEYTGNDYATTFINWFADFEIPLSYSLDMEIEGYNYIDVITTIEGGFIKTVVGQTYFPGNKYAEHILQDHHVKPDRLSTSMEITSKGPKLEVNQMVLLYKYVYGDVTPNLDLKFKINGVTKASIDLATWDTESFFSASRTYQSSTVHFEWELDSDNDGVADSIDAFPYDRTQTSDADGDGFGDNVNGNNPDALIYDSTQWLDIDADGYGDNQNGNNPDAFIYDSNQWLDTDADGYGDNLNRWNSDVFIYDPTQWFDTDADGYGDNQNGNNPDAFIYDSNQWLDTDADGYGDNLNRWNSDAFIYDPTQWADADGDGYGDNPLGSNPDMCPDNYGEMTESTVRGCPDLDNDGIMDENDDCENTAENEEVVNDVGCTNSQLDFFDREYSVVGTVVEMPVIFSTGFIFFATIILILFATIRRRKSRPSSSDGLGDSWNDYDAEFLDFGFQQMPPTDQAMIPSPPNFMPPVHETIPFTPIETTPMQQMESQQEYEQQQQAPLVFSPIPENEFEQPMAAMTPIEENDLQNQFVNSEPAIVMNEASPPIQNVAVP